LARDVEVDAKDLGKTEDDLRWERSRKVIQAKTESERDSSAPAPMCRLLQAGGRRAPPGRRRVHRALVGLYERATRGRRTILDATKR